MSLDKIISHLLLVLFVLYQSQGILISKDGSIGSISLLMIYVISFVYFIKILTSHEGITNFMKVWIAFLIFPVFSFIFTGNLETEDSIFRQILTNFLPFFPVYYFANKGILTRQHLILFLILLLPVLSIKFFQTTSAIQLERGREDVVSNSIYPIMGLLPFVFLIRNKLISFGIINLIWFLSVQSNKRAAIVAGAITLILFLYQNIYLSSQKNKIWNYLSAFVFIIGISYFAFYYYQQNYYLQERINLMMDGQTSGRDNLFEELFNAWYHSDSFFNYLFGLGFNASRAITTHVSHNDWIDVLGSYGLVGLIFFLLLWKALINQFFDKYWNKSKKISYILILIIAFLATMVFRWYDSPFPFMNSVLLPYLLATKYNDD